MAVERSVSWIERNGQRVADALTLFRISAIPFAVGLLASEERVAAQKVLQPVYHRGE